MALRGCISINCLPLQILMKDNPGWEGTPVAVTKEEKPQSPILALNRQAREKGLAAGVSYSSALSLVPDLRARAVPQSRVAAARDRIVGLLSAFLTWTLIGARSSKTQVVPIDKVGLFLLVLGVGTLQIMLDKGNELDWFESGDIVVLCVVAVVALSVLVVWELTDKHPVVDLHLFARRNFLVGTLILSFGYLVFFGNVVILPLWLQTNMGYTATWAGLATAPIGILPVFLSALVGKNMYRIDLRIWPTFSFAVFAAISFWTSQFNTDVGFSQIVIPRLLMGFGVAGFFVPLTALTLAGIPPEMMASATGLSNFCRILAGSFGTSLSITLWERRADYHHSILAEHITAFDPATSGWFGTLANPALDHARLARLIDEQAVMLATNDLFFLSGCCFVALMLLLWLARPPKTAPAVRP